MSKWSSRLAALATGFLLALTVHFAWRWHQPLSLCDIDRNPDKYSGRIIRVRALVSNDVSVGAPVDLGGPRISAFSACVGNDDWPAAIVDLDAQQLSLVRETRHLWRQEQENQKFYVSDVILVGMFDPHDDGITHCWAPKYELVNSKIERVVSIRELTSEQILEWVRSNSW